MNLQDLNQVLNCQLRTRPVTLVLEMLLRAALSLAGAHPCRQPHLSKMSQDTTELPTSTLPTSSQPRSPSCTRPKQHAGDAPLACALLPPRAGPALQPGSRPSQTRPQIKPQRRSQRSAAVSDTWALEQQQQQQQQCRHQRILSDASLSGRSPPVPESLPPKPRRTAPSRSSTTW